MKKNEVNAKYPFKMTRRQILKAGFVGGAGLFLPLRFLPPQVFAAGAIGGLSDPLLQPKFEEIVPDALSPGFIYNPALGDNLYKVGAGYNASHETGLEMFGSRVTTPIYGYGDINDEVYTWPGRTFQIQSNKKTIVKWYNNLPLGQYLITSLNDESVVDTSLHWAYSLHGYENLTIDEDGVPIVFHLHGGHSKSKFDGNPEQFFTPGWQIEGPRFSKKKYVYPNDQPAGNLWYHDHALGITRLNVYAGMAGFYFLRDKYDTGEPDNPLGLPAWPYEKAYAIQDRMFKETGELFFPAFDGDPFWEDFITGEGAMPDPPGGPSGLAEFFGDHMVVNGKIWPKEPVEPRQYRLHLLNGTDSRFMAIRFRPVSLNDTDLTSAGPPIPFKVIGSDQGLAARVNRIGKKGYLLIEPGSRYDIVINFRRFKGERIIMENLGGDEPFGGDLPGPFIFDCTDRIMAFDVTEELDRYDHRKSDKHHPINPFNNFKRYKFGPDVGEPQRIRKVALFEGKDEYGRLQPLLGTAEPATDRKGKPINWPDTDVYRDAGLIGQMEGAVPWHSPTTENPKLNSTEEWEIWNATGDAHPVHLHLVHFEVIGRQEIFWDSNADEDGFMNGHEPADDGVYLERQAVIQHNGKEGIGFKFVFPSDPEDAYGRRVRQPKGYVENSRKDMVTALPGQITRIKAKFDKPGRYVWHCHILSHEDHEMMRVLHVGKGV